MKGGKIPHISNHFSKCDHKGELAAVFSAIYYLKVIQWLFSCETHKESGTLSIPKHAKGLSGFWVLND